MASHEAPDFDLRKAVTLMQQAAVILDHYCAKMGDSIDLTLEIATSTYLRARSDRLIPPQDGWPKDDNGNTKVIDLQTWKRKA